ncbi:MAG: glycosylase [Planctomycetota bacterium]
MLPRRFTQQLLRPEDLSPSRPDLKVLGVFNPALVAKPNCPDDTLILMARVAESPTDTRDGHHALPRYTQQSELVVEYLPHEDDILGDPRKVIRKADQLMRLKFVSHIRVWELELHREAPDANPVPRITKELPSFLPQSECETFGVEDPRITPLTADDGTLTYWITYVSVSEHGACTSLAITHDFHAYERLGVCFAPENKDVVLGPERIDDRLIALHRPNTFQRFCKPEMWSATSSDGRDWGQHRPLFGGTAWWDNDRIGAGPPPVLLDDDRLLCVYHGSAVSTVKGKVGAYRAGLLALDRQQPWEVVGHTPEPIMQAELDWEQQGFVPDVVFPTGLATWSAAQQRWLGGSDVPQDDDELLVAYGAADTHVGLTAYRIADLKSALKA